MPTYDVEITARIVKTVRIEISEKDAESRDLIWEKAYAEFNIASEVGASEYYEAMTACKLVTDDVDELVADILKEHKESGEGAGTFAGATYRLYHECRERFPTVESAVKYLQNLPEEPT